MMSRKKAPTAFYVWTVAAAVVAAVSGPLLLVVSSPGSWVVLGIGTALIAVALWRGAVSVRRYQKTLRNQPKP